MNLHTNLKSVNIFLLVEKIALNIQSIKRQKWFRGPDLLASKDQLNKPIPKCATSVGLNTAFMINFYYTYSYNFTTSLQGQSRQTKLT